MGSSRSTTARVAGRVLRARRALLGCVALVVVAGGIAGCTTSPGTTTQPSANPTSSGGSGNSPCPSTPVAGPAHTLTFPQSIDGYQAAGPPTNSTTGESVGNSSCTLAQQSDGYQNSQGSFVTIVAGHHPDLWHSFNDFWGPFFAASGIKIVMVPAGPLGGQAGCGTSSQDTICNWLDNDTFGSFTGNGSSMSQAQTASLMVAFRNAIEQSG